MVLKKEDLKCETGLFLKIQVDESMQDSTFKMKQNTEREARCGHLFVDSCRVS